MEAFCLALNVLTHYENEHGRENQYRSPYSGLHTFLFTMMKRRLVKDIPISSSSEMSFSQFT